MTLRTIVAAFGGDLYAGGARASIPAPGHSAADRSVSLLLNGDRLVIHGFGGADWREVRDLLRGRGFIDHDGRLTGAPRSPQAPPRPDRRQREAAATRLWAGALVLEAGSLAARHLGLRGVINGCDALNLGFHPRAPISVYRQISATRAALVARVSDEEDRLTAVEITYLAPSGRRATDLNLSRKTVGHMPAGAAVRLSQADDEMLVAEGVTTTLSAMARFQLPGWALMSANNLAVWTPPPGVRRVLIAGDRGVVGQAAALRLRSRLEAAGLSARATWPGPPFGDWNEAAVGQASARGEGGR